MEPRSLPLAVLKGLRDGASLASASGTELSTQVEIFSAKYFPLCVFTCWRYICVKTSGDPISLTPSYANSKAHTKNTGSRCLSKPLVACVVPIASTVESEKRQLT